MELIRRPAHPALRDLVRSFSERRAMLGEAIVTAPLPARPDQFIEIYLHDRYRVSQDGAAPELSPEMVAVGPQSYRRTRLFLSGDLKVFTIAFTPGGFNALFGTPMTELVDQGAPARDVIGGAADGLRDAVLLARDFDARVAAAQCWIAALVDLPRPVDRVGRLATALQRSHGRLRIDALAERAGLSRRQFTRRFERQVGLTPKLFARVVRFDALLAARAQSPKLLWTSLSHRFGYADQSHFNRDCREFTGDTPAAFFPEWLAGR